MKMNETIHGEELFYLTSNYDKAMETRQRAKQIPYLSFPSHWDIKIMPPFGGATVRFGVRVGTADVSIYLDMDGALGACELPYWEVYPGCYRCGMDETNKLLTAIEISLEQQRGGRK